MSKSKTTWKQIPSDRAMLRTVNLLKIIAKAEVRLKQQGKTWSINSRNKGGGKKDEKEYTFVLAGN